MIFFLYIYDDIKEYEDKNLIKFNIIMLLNSWKLKKIIWIYFNKNIEYWNCCINKWVDGFFEGLIYYCYLKVNVLCKSNLKLF